MVETEVRFHALTDQGWEGPIRAHIVATASGEVLAEVTLDSWDDTEPLHQAFDELAEKQRDDGR